LSGGGSADKRRKPRKQRVGFDDVQGVDEAKEELVEVNVAFASITSLRCLMNVARQKNHLVFGSIGNSSLKKKQ